MKRVLVTGHRGYIGSHLVALLKEAGHHVTGCDARLFDGCEWGPLVPADREIVGDVRDLTPRQLAGVDTVMHLAAISNDPMGDVAPGLTLAVNRDASVRLARIARNTGVERFLFAGSCSVYGKGAKPDLDESDAVNPLTAYARSKIEAEAAILPLAGGGFTPVSLRNATAYGHSPMLRVDLVVNNLLASALVHGEIRIMSDGSPWRPLVHCRDIARAFCAFMDAPAADVAGLAVNVGGDSENLRVRDVAGAVARHVPSAGVVYTGEAGPDPRDYRVSFGLLGRVLPGFRLEYTVERGVEALHRELVDGGFSLADFTGPRFVRLRALHRRLARAA